MSLPDGVAGASRGGAGDGEPLGFAPASRLGFDGVDGRATDAARHSATASTCNAAGAAATRGGSGTTEAVAAKEALRAAAAAPAPTSAPAAAAASASASTARGGFLDAREEPPALRVSAGVRRLGALGDGPERLRGLERLRRALHARRARVPRVQGADQAGDVPERREVAHRQERLGEVLQHERIPWVHGESHLQRVARRDAARPGARRARPACATGPRPFRRSPPPRRSTAATGRRARPRRRRGRRRAGPARPAAAGVFS